MTGKSSATGVDKAGQLIAQIDAEAASEAMRIAVDAAEDAQAVMRAARARARQHVAREIAELRRRREVAVTFEKARIETARRHILQQAHRETIERTAPLLRQALVALWKDETARRGWIENAVAEATAHLMPGAWVVTHPDDWSPDDAASVTNAVARAAGQAPILEPDCDIRAGLRLRSGSACLDASAEALLSDPQDLGAQLLGALADTGPGKGGTR